MKYWYSLAKPSDTHKTFRIKERNKETGKVTTVADRKIDAINEMFLKGLQDAEVTLRQIQEVMETYRKASRPPSENVYLDSNLDIMERYFKEHYTDRDNLPESTKSAKAAFKRAVALLGNLNLTTADAADVQAKINALAHEKRQSIVVCLNALFKYVKRDHKFQVGKKKSKSVQQVKHLTLEEFLTVLPNIENKTVRNLAATAFASGCRVGESFSLEDYDEQSRKLTVQTQIDREGNEREAKTYQARFTVVIQDLEQYVKDWIATPNEERLSIRNARISKLVKDACMTTFPASRSKWCHFYDLRHSYAIHWLVKKRVPLDLVAAALGNSPEVCRKHGPRRASSCPGFIQERAERDRLYIGKRHQLSDPIRIPIRGSIDSTRDPHKARAHQNPDGVLVGERGQRINFSFGGQMHCCVSSALSVITPVRAPENFTSYSREF